MAKAKKNSDIDEQAEKRALIDQIIAEADEMYGKGCVQRAEDANCSYLLRRPTGLLSLDLAMAGGWAASAPSVLVGPDGVGKDYLLWRTAAESQQIYGDDFCMACYFTEFKPDKRYMKDFCGFHIAFSEEEIEEMSIARYAAGQAELTADELDYYRYQVGTFIPILGLSADHGFDVLFKFMESCACQIVAVNSIGFLQTEAKEKTESFEDFAQQRNEAALLNKALPKLAMYLNKGNPKGGANETALILVNQVRSKDATSRPMPGRPQQEKDTYKTAANAWALKHGKSLELFLHNGSKIYDEKAKPPTAIGRKKQWEIAKGKLGTHEGIRGEFNYFYGTGADIAGDLLDVAVGMGIVQAKGAWMSYDEPNFKFNLQGGPRVIQHIQNSPELLTHLREHCFQQSGVLCRTK